MGHTHEKEHTMSDATATLPDKIDTYLYHHTAMEGLQYALEESSKWQSMPGDGAKKRTIPELRFHDALGNQRFMQVTEYSVKPSLAGDSCIYAIKLGQKGPGGNAHDNFRNHRDALPTILIRREGEHFILGPINQKDLDNLEAGECTPQTVPYKLRSDALMRKVQFESMNALAEQLHQHKKGGIAKIGTGTGKSFAIGHTINANGAQGVILTANPTLAAQLRDDCIKCGADPTKIFCGEGVQPLLDDASKIQDRATYPIVILTFDQLQRYQKVSYKNIIAQLRDQLVCIDEPHEASRSSHGLKNLQRVVEQNGNYFALTATPTPEIVKIMQPPFFKRSLCDAMNEKYFRRMVVRTDSAGENLPGRQEFLDKKWPETTEEWAERNREEDALNAAAGDDFIEKALLGYFGSDAYMLPDDDGYRPPSHNADIATQDVEALRHNRVRFAEHKNIAFTVRPELAKKLAEAYQAIADGEFKPPAGFLETIATRRNEAAIDAMQARCEQVGRPVDRAAAEAKCRDGGLLTDATSINLQAEAQQALKQEICHAINREYLAFALGKTPGTMHRILAKNATEITAYQCYNILINKHHDAFQSFRYELMRSGTFESEEISQIWQTIQERVKNGETPILKPEDIDLAKFPDARYCQSVTNDNMNDQVMKEAKRKLDRGLCVHTINNYQFESGLNDLGILSVQRLIENVGPYITRAKQIAGRPIRSTGLLAMAQDIVGPTINKDGIPGKDSPFLTERDVMATDDDVREEIFMNNFKNFHENNPRYQAASPGAHVSRTAVANDPKAVVAA
jgi:hypothetical protein